MFDWLELLTPPNPQDAARCAAWFAAIAHRLLAGSRLFVGGEPHRFAEIEFYWNSTDHPDPFAHCDPIQLECGRWYFHRTAGVYRAGSFKGLDLSFGSGGAHGGVLIRSLQRENGEIVDGPSLSVDHLLKLSAAGTVATLDKVIAGRKAWDPNNPVYLKHEEPDDTPVYRSPRVGLTLKRGHSDPRTTRYLMRRYRFLTSPKGISKGKLHMVLAFHGAGASNEEIYKLTGCPRASIQRYVNDCEAGKQLEDITPYFGKDLKPADLSKLYGWSLAKGLV
jgi:3-methyladenine DNA glycosylase Mpg